MEKQIMGVNFDLKFEKIQNLNPSFDLARISVAYAGLNRNRSRIEKGVFEKALPSLFNVPLVGRYIPEENDFGAHDISVVVGDNGEFKVENATVPFGVVPESSEPSWETVEEEDGTKRDYLFTNCVLWKRSYGYETLVSQDKWGQSMEIEVNDYDIDENGVMNIKDMTFTALCILGNNSTPCFESASVQIGKAQEKASFSSQFSLMLDDFKVLTSQAVKLDFSNISEEGGAGILSITEEARDSILAEYGISIESIDFDYSEMTEEDFRLKVESLKNESNDPNFAKDDNEDDKENEAIEDEEKNDDKDTDEDFKCGDKKTDEEDYKCGDKKTDEEDYKCGDKKNEDEDYKCGDDDDKKKKFSDTFFEKYEKLCKAVRAKGCAESTENADVWYWLSDFDDNYLFVNKSVCVDCECESKCGRCTYVIDAEDNIVIGDFEEMIVKWLTIDENEKIEKDREELESLRAYKSERLKLEHEAEIDDVIDKFMEIVDTAEFTALKSSIYNLSVDEVTEKLFAIRGRYSSLPKKDDSSNKNARIPLVEETKTKTNSRYGNLFAMYGNKN